MFVSGWNVEKLIFMEICNFTFMKQWILLCALSLSGTIFAQEEIDLKGRFEGTYEGTVPEYRVQSDDELLFVAETPIQIVIGENQVQVQIGSNRLYGTYDVMFEADKYYLLDVSIDGQLANERIIVYKRGKKLSRDGMFPQPVTSLEKLSNRELRKRRKNKD